MIRSSLTLSILSALVTGNAYSPSISVQSKTRTATTQSIQNKDSDDERRIIIDAQRKIGAELHKL